MDNKSDTEPIDSKEKTEQLPPGPLSHFQIISLLLPLLTPAAPSERAEETKSTAQYPAAEQLYGDTELSPTLTAWGTSIPASPGPALWGLPAEIRTDFDVGVSRSGAETPTWYARSDGVQVLKGRHFEMANSDSFRGFGAFQDSWRDTDCSEG